MLGLSIAMKYDKAYSNDFIITNTYATIIKINAAIDNTETIPNPVAAREEPII